MTSTAQPPPDSRATPPTPHTPPMSPGPFPGGATLPTGYSGDTTPCALCGRPAPAGPVPTAGQLPGIRSDRPDGTSVLIDADDPEQSAPLCQPCLDCADHDGYPLIRRQRVTASFLVYLDVDIDPVDAEGRWRDTDPSEPLAEDIADELRAHLAYEHPELGDLVQRIHKITARPANTLAAVRDVIARVRRHEGDLPAIQAAIEVAECSGSSSQSERAFDAREAHHAANTYLLDELVSLLAPIGFDVGFEMDAS